MTRTAVLLCLVTFAPPALAQGKLPTVLQLFSLAHPNLIHGAKGSYTATGTADTRGGAPVEVDLANGYLSWTDDFSAGVGTRTTVAALFVTDDKRALLAELSTDERPMATTQQLTFYEYRGGRAVKLQPAPLPAYGPEAMLVPGASFDELGKDKKLAGALQTFLTLPKVGTTIVARLDSSALESQAGSASVHEFVEKRLYKKLELLFDTKKGTFSAGAPSMDSN